MEIPEQVLTVWQRLSCSGFQPYLVGGCVRDLLRGCQPGDYDMTSAALPEEVMALFGKQAHPTGLSHGTVTVVSGGMPIEITTMRCDGAYRDARHPEAVYFTDDIAQDLARRDFTVNAMALAPDGTLVDPFGGQEDLHRGILRCVGRPEQRLEEDALRILRALRFCAVLGFTMEGETAHCVYEKRRKLSLVAHERVLAELNKMLCGGNVTDVLLSCSDVLGVVLPEILPCVGLDQKNPHHCYDVWGHTAYAVGAVRPERDLRWVMLLHDLGKAETFSLDEAGIGHFYGHTARSAVLAEGIMARLHFDGALSASIRTQLGCFDEMFRPERRELHCLMARLGRETVDKLIETKLADNAGKAPEGLARAQRPWREARLIFDQLVCEGACCSVRELEIGGDELQNIGFSGREIGAVLHRLLEETASEKLNNDAASLRARSERLFRSGWRGNKKEEA